MAFLYLGANLGKIKCGTGSRWTLSLSALVTVGISTAAGFGLSSLAGLFYGPVHSLLPFILLGIGVDDIFVIANAFDRERKTSRTEENNDALAKRCARALARAGSSITVTSATDLVAFGISSSSRLPALASFCAYAAICIFFLWAFAATFFTATMVFDERRQRDNRRECLCCATRKNPIPEEEDNEFQEDLVATYFRKYHSPAILSKVGKIVVLLSFSGLFGFGVWGMLKLQVEDSERAFIPQVCAVAVWNCCSFFHLKLSAVFRCSEIGLLLDRLRRSCR
jgi:Niemann-Pick C1 protein